MTCAPTPFSDLDDEAFVRLATVRSLIPCSANTIYRLVRSGEFPSPYRLSEFAVAWKVADLRNWMASRQLADAVESAQVRAARKSAAVRAEKRLLMEVI